MSRVDDNEQLEEKQDVVEGLTVDGIDEAAQKHSKAQVVDASKPQQREHELKEEENTTAFEDPQRLEAAKAKQKRRPLMLPTLVLEKREWPALKLESEVAAAASMLKDRSFSTLRVLTWNVWFDDLCGEERQVALMQEALAQAPDVLCLQEVKRSFLEAMRNCPELCALYDISPQDVGAYGCSMMVRRDFGGKFQESKLPSQMGRMLLSVDCTARCPGLYIMTTHLESLNSRGRRAEQLRCAATALKDRPLSVICGDFNFDDTKTWGVWKKELRQRCEELEEELGLENEILKEVLPAYSDSWREVWPDEPGYTFDGLENGVCVMDSQERMRYDRVLARSDHLKPTAAVLCGQTAINTWGVCPSDHYGLSVDMDIICK